MIKCLQLLNHDFAPILSPHRIHFQNAKSFFNKVLPYTNARNEFIFQFILMNILQMVLRSFSPFLIQNDVILKWILFIFSGTFDPIRNRSKQPKAVNFIEH